ncbi:hypothetical protein HED60_19410 [Planctomycetales bacterium ZRK34]|nr:hypothetical protein HED60_19410 [Planctomycetales bacterium ZRK34]
MADIVRGIVFENSAVITLARIRKNTGDNAQQSDISSITCNIYDISDTSAAQSTPSVTVSSVIYDTLQTDSRWTADSTGYNFAHEIPAWALWKGDTTYRIEYLFTPASGEAFYAAYEVSTIQIFSSSDSSS